ELAHRGVAGFEHLHVQLCGHRVQRVGIEARGHAVHGVAPGPERIGRMRLTLRQPRHRALEGMRMQVGDAGQAPASGNGLDRQRGQVGHRRAAGGGSGLGYRAGVFLSLAVRCWKVWRFSAWRCWRRSWCCSRDAIACARPGPGAAGAIRAPPAAARHAAMKRAAMAMAEAAVTEAWDGVLVGASLATLQGDAGYGTIEDGALGWREGRIVFAGRRAELPGEPERLADCVI